MKAKYRKPEIEVIEVEVSELMATSDPEAMNTLGFDNGGNWNEKKSGGINWD